MFFQVQDGNTKRQENTVNQDTLMWVSHNHNGQTRLWTFNQNRQHLMLFKPKFQTQYILLMLIFKNHANIEHFSMNTPLVPHAPDCYTPGALNQLV